MVETTDICGPMSLTLHASTTDSEVLWFVQLLEVDRKDAERLLTRGWLRGSQRRIDPNRSKPWLPYHTHEQREPLTPNEIYEFNIEIRPYGIRLRPGYRLAIRVSGTTAGRRRTIFTALPRAMCHGNPVHGYRSFMTVGIPRNCSCRLPGATASGLSSPVET